MGRPEEPVTPDPAQAAAIFELMIMTALADGRVEGAEALAIRKLLETTEALQGFGSTAEIGKQVRNRVQLLGLEESVRGAAARVEDREHQELAFQCCARVMGADGNFAGEEAQMLALLQEAFGLGTEDVRRLLVLATMS